MPPRDLRYYYLSYRLLTAMNYIFGPLISRRLGRSLGVDVIPFKTCTYDCIYCQLGPTIAKTAVRAEYVPLDDVIAELREKLAAGVEADYISIAGSGEPTLYSRLGDLIAQIKQMTGVPVCVISNGSLFWRQEVRDSVKQADLIIPSLDAAASQSFLAINRPVPEINFEQMVDGLVRLRDEFSGEIALEIFVVAPIPGRELDIEHLAGLVRRIRPDHVQLNTLARPAPGSPVQPASAEYLQKIAASIGPDTEIIATHAAPAEATKARATPDDVYNIIRRHPCTAEELATALGITDEQARANIDDLRAQNRAAAIEKDGATFYVAV